MKKTTTLIVLLGITFFIQAQQKVKLEDNSNANDFYYNNGNVGIGTVDPQAKLQVLNGNILVGKSDHGGGEINFGNPNHGIKREGNEVSLFTAGGSESGISFAQKTWTGDSYNGWKVNMKITDVGNVGIGTVDPQAKLQVLNGNILVGKSDHGGGEINFGNPNHGIKREGNEVSLFTAGGSESGISFVQKTWTGDSYNGWKVNMKITDNGNVGIGTTTPDMKLTVKGSIHAEEVKIDLSVPAPDYVFAKDYNLKSIAEVEKYILKNSHLPEIPSAKEFAENGVLLAEMNMSLLKKIEELTLYTIQQQKEIEELKSMMAKLLTSKK